MQHREFGGTWFGESAFYYFESHFEPHEGHFVISLFQVVVIWENNEINHGVLNPVWSNMSKQERSYFCIELFIWS